MPPSVHDKLNSKIAAQHPEVGDISCVLWNTADLLEDYARMLCEITRSVEIDWPPKIPN